MKEVTDPAPSFFGVVLGRDKHFLQLNKQEIATLRRAAAIREEARDRLATILGQDAFEGSGFYTLTIDDLIEIRPWWDDLDMTP